MTRLQSAQILQADDWYSGRGIAAVRRTTGILCFVILPALSAVGAKAQNTLYPTVTVAGPAANVFDYKTQACDSLDIPDAFFRAFRRDDGEIVGLATHYVNRPLLGRALTELRHDCHNVYQGRNLADPSSFDNLTWLAATWTDDGRSVISLGHNEYHANRFSYHCKYNTESQCWYNSIVLLHSYDGGIKFERADLGAPTPLVAAPFKSEIEQGRPRGYFDPSNVFALGEFKYTLIAQRGIDNTTSGRCLFRTKSPDQLNSWAMYDGHDYVPTAGTPYYGKQPKVSCQPATGIHGTLGSVTRLRGTSMFAAVSIVGSDDPKFVGAIEIAFSEDLIHWSGNLVVMNLSAFWSKYCLDGHRYNYPSLLDDNDTGRNFDSIGNEAWLFLVRSHCSVTMDRDLVRFNIRIGWAPSRGLVADQNSIKP